MPQAGTGKLWGAAALQEFLHRSNPWMLFSLRLAQGVSAAPRTLSVLLLRTAWPELLGGPQSGCSTPGSGPAPRTRGDPAGLMETHPEQRVMLELPFGGTARLPDTSKSTAIIRERPTRKGDAEGKEAEHERTQTLSGNTWQKGKNNQPSKEC